MIKVLLKVLEQIGEQDNALLKKKKKKLTNRLSVQEAEDSFLKKKLPMH